MTFHQNHVYLDACPSCIWLFSWPHHELKISSILNLHAQMEKERKVDARNEK